MTEPMEPAETHQPSAASNGAAHAVAPVKIKPWHRLCDCGEQVPIRTAICPGCGAGQPRLKGKPKPKNKTRKSTKAKPRTDGTPREALDQLASHYRKQAILEAIKQLERLLSG